MSTKLYQYQPIWECDAFFFWFASNVLTRSNENATRRERYESMSPPHRGRGLSPRSPAEQVRGREQFRDDIPDASPVGNGQGRLDRRHGRRSESAERPYSPRPKDALLKSPSKQDRLRYAILS
jgi:hypothetical protein